MKKKISIRDIARDMNVSTSTVSFVINGRGEEMGISTEVTRRVQEHVEKIGYRPNHLAKSLRTGKTFVVGMLMEFISDPFFSAIARQVEANANESGYKVFFSSTENNTGKTKELIGILRDRNVDGYIIAPPPGIEADIKSLVDEHIPVVLFDRFFPDMATHNVVIDNKGGAYVGTQLMGDAGAKSIAIITLNSTQSQMADRLSGYLEGIKEFGQDPIVCKVTFGQTHEAMVNKIRDFLLAHNEIDGLLFGTNYIAIAGLHAIQEIGRSIPDEIAVVGFDDNSHFSLFSPPITAVAQPEDEIARSSTDLLMQLIKDPAEIHKPRTIVLPTRLMLRQSHSKRAIKNVNQ